MKHHPLIPALLLSLGLTACGGGGGGTSTAPGTQPSPAPLPTPTPTPVPTPTPTPTDACTNYEGEQTLAEIQAKGFVRLNDGTCRLERNHEALSTSGFDLARMKGYTGQGITVAVFDTGFRDHQEYSGRVLWGAKYIDLNKDAKLQDGEAILGDWDANSVEVYHGPAVASVVAGKTLGAAMSATLVFAAEGTPNYIHGEEFAIAHEDLIKNKSISIINNSNGMGEGGVLYWSALQGTTNHDPYGFMNTLVYSPSVVIFGAGNSGLDFSDTLDRYFKDMATYGLEAVTPFNDPREAENLLYVGSFDRAKNELALYSNYPGHRKAVQDRFLVTGIV